MKFSPYFPLFISLKSKKVLIVGGGRVALRKIKALEPFQAEIKIVALDILDEIKKLNFVKEIHQRSFLENDLEGVDIVVVAINNLKLQKEIFIKSGIKNILCNCVDLPEFCHFFFPALVVKGDLSIGISTAGRAPSVSRRVRQLVQNILPDNLLGIIEKISKMRKGESHSAEGIIEETNQQIPFKEKD